MLHSTPQKQSLGCLGVSVCGMCTHTLGYTLRRTFKKITFSAAASHCRAAPWVTGSKKEQRCPRHPGVRGFCRL